MDRRCVDEVSMLFGNAAGMVVEECCGRPKEEAVEIEPLRSKTDE
jgi:hypothetical protein